MKTNVITLGATALLIAFSFGCSGPQVQYGDAQAVETLTVDFGSTDLQMIAEKMVNSLLATNVVDPSTRPVIFVAPVRNKTSEHIDTKSITDKIRTTLLKSGRFRFSAAQEFARELESQYQHQASDKADHSTGVEYGRQIGAEYMIAGEITSIRKSEGRYKDVYYKITLNLVNIESALIDWADEKEIRKGQKKPLVGR